jgi:hypothetical protein
MIWIRTNRASPKNSFVIQDLPIKFIGNNEGKIVICDVTNSWQRIVDDVLIGRELKVVHVNDLSMETKKKHQKISY